MTLEAHTGFWGRDSNTCGVLVTASCDVGNAYCASSRKKRFVDRTHQELDKFRSAIDGRVFDLPDVRDNPDHPFGTAVYYGIRRRTDE